jgi:hypothetical protein
MFRVQHFLGELQHQCILYENEWLLFNKNVDINFFAHSVFLEKPSSGSTLPKIDLIVISSFFTFTRSPK